MIAKVIRMKTTTTTTIITKNDPIDPFYGSKSVILETFRNAIERILGLHEPENILLQVASNLPRSPDFKEVSNGSRDMYSFVQFERRYEKGNPRGRGSFVVGTRRSGFRKGK